MNNLSFLAVALLCILSRAQVTGFSTVAPDVRTTGNALSEDQLIALTKEYLETKNGFYAQIDPDFHADDFIFRAGVVGPLNKRDYCETMTKLGIYKAFDLNPNAFGFCVDPEEPLAVRFFLRYTGKQVKPWIVGGTPLEIPVNDKPIQGPTESVCIKFNEKGKVKFFTLSNPMNYGNPNEPTTGELGAVLGLFNHVGLPNAAKSALNENVRNVSIFLANLLPAEVGPPRSRSNPENLPTWWAGY